MNKIFKTIWNRARRCYVAVNESVCRAKQANGATHNCSLCKSGGVFLTALAGAFTSLVLNAVQAETISESLVIDSDSSYNELTMGSTSVSIGSVSLKSDAYKFIESVGGLNYRAVNNTGHRWPDPSWYDDYSDAMEISNQQRTEWIQNTFGEDGLDHTADYYLYHNLDYLHQNTSLSNFGKITVDENGDLYVTGTLTLGVIQANVNVTLSNAYVRHQYIYGANNDHAVSEVKKNTSNLTGTISINAALVNNGGFVDIGGDLILENPENTYTQNGGSTSIDGIGGEGSVIINDGTLSTSGGVLIDISEAKAADIGAYELFDSSKAITVTSLAAGEKSKVSGMSAQSDQFTINGGTLNIEGTYEQHIADQAEQLLKDYYGQNINVTFDEIVADQTLDLSNGYTTAVLNSIYDENGRGDVLFHSLNWNAQSQNLVIGDDDMVRNIGVKNIDNAKQVTVTGGKTFAILGDGTGRTVNGTFVADNGNLVFGAAGLTSGGTVSSVLMRNDGNVTVANGAFVFGSLAGEGNFSVAQTGSAILTDYVADGSFTNAGSVTISGDLTFADGSEMTSSGNLTTGLDNVFQNVEPSVVDPLKVIGLNASLPEEIRTVASDLFRKYVPGEVADSLAQHATFTGGKVTITGVDLTETQVADLTQAFKEQLFPRF